MAALIASIWLAAASPATATTFVLANGGQIEGRLVNPDQQPRETYVIEVASGAQLTLTRTQVDRVVDQSEARDWYRTWLPKTPQTVEGHWTMAEECRNRGLKNERDFHLHRILELDPQHEAARHGLGFSKVNGRWVQTDQWMTEQGYVRYRGTWRLPHDVVLEHQAAETDLRE